MVERTEYQRQYYLKNKERIKNRDRERDDEIKEYRRNHYQDNKEKINARNKEWKIKNKDKQEKWQREYSKLHYQKNKEKRLAQIKIWKQKNRLQINIRRNRNNRRDGIKRRYGMSLETFNTMLISQEYRCAICGNIFKNDKDTNVDHCHATGKTRSLLCFKCNVGIGKLNDSIELVEKALEYLKRWHLNLQI